VLWAQRRPGAGPQPSPTGPPPLLACCVRVLALHLEELIDCGDAVLPYLPAECKACLLAAGRSRGLLTDQALDLLADEGQELLDLRGGGAAVSDPGIRAALRALPDLRQLDVSGCSVRGDTLRALGSACPALELLRLGTGERSSAACVTNHGSHGLTRPVCRTCNPCRGVGSAQRECFGRRAKARAAWVVSLGKRRLA
jgi:hypothetical protein